MAYPKKHVLPEGVSTRTHETAVTGCGIRLRASLKAPGAQHWYNPRTGKPVIVQRVVTCERCQDAIGRNPNDYRHVQAY